VVPRLGIALSVKALVSQSNKSPFRGFVSGIIVLRRISRKIDFTHFFSFSAEILILTLKRFLSHGPYSRTKIYLEVDFPLT
jgi:hypothetical protein